MTHLASKLLLSGLGLAALAATATAAAPADTVAPAVAVRYDSMMLATDRGARTLYARLSAAADKVCQDDSVGSHLPSVAACSAANRPSRRRWKRCTTRVWSRCPAAASSPVKWFG